MNLVGASIDEPVDSLERAFLARVRRWSYSNGLTDYTWHRDDSAAVCVHLCRRSLYVGRITGDCFGVVLFSRFLLECSNCDFPGDLGAFAAMHHALSIAVCAVKQADDRRSLAADRHAVNACAAAVCRSLRIFAETLTSSYCVLQPEDCFEAILIACRSNLRGMMPKGALRITGTESAWPLY